MIKETAIGAANGGLKPERSVAHHLALLPMRKGLPAAP
jgi:hypothetical protein